MTATHRSSLDYVLLWDVSDITSLNIKVTARNKAERWPKLPTNPISPNPVNINFYRPSVKPLSSLGGRHTRRGGGYVSLINYNNLP